MAVALMDLAGNQFVVGASGIIGGNGVGGRRVWRGRGNFGLGDGKLG